MCCTCVLPGLLSVLEDGQEGQAELNQQSPLVNHRLVLSIEMARTRIQLPIFRHTHEQLAANS